MLRVEVVVREGAGREAALTDAAGRSLVADVIPLATLKDGGAGQG